MKIILKNKVYVQRCDLINLAYIVSMLSIPCPCDIFEKLYGPIFICDGTNKYEFLEFKGSEAVEFFRSLDYIVDYDELKTKSDEDLADYANSIDKEVETIIDEFNAKPESERREEYERTDALINSKKLKIYGIRDFMQYRKGDIVFDLPKTISEKSTEKKSGAKVFVNKIFKR